MIYFISDWHFNHNKDFIYEVRGFDSVEEMNQAILQRHNNVVTNNDDVYVLGDLCLGQNLEENLQLINQMHGRLHLVRGNHDSNKRWEAYGTLNNIVEQKDAIFLHYKKMHFFLSHFPSFTGNKQKESLNQMTCNIFGHTHDFEHFYFDEYHTIFPFMYNVACDAHDCTPVSIDDIIKEMQEQYYG